MQNDRPKREIWAPAKLNVHLRVIGRRPDGYHELISVMVPVSLFDRIQLEIIRPRRIIFASDGFPVPAGQENLACQAAQAFLDRTGFEQGFSIKLTKNIPVAAGLGGGSSDAGCILHALHEMCSYSLSEQDLNDLAVGLGADVPFFLQDGPCIARGIGEILEPIKKWPGFWYVIVTPPLAISTSWVYGNLKNRTLPRDRHGGRQEEGRHSPGRHLELTTDKYGAILTFFRNRPFKIADILENDLEKVTASRYPIIDNIKKSLVQAGALGALMSGSGPSVFGIFETKNEALMAKRRLTSQNLGGVFAVTDLMGCRQAVRHGPLEPAFGGSNPPTPAIC